MSFSGHACSSLANPRSPGVLRALSAKLNKGGEDVFIIFAGAIVLEEPHGVFGFLMALRDLSSSVADTNV